MQPVKITIDSSKPCPHKPQYQLPYRSKHCHHTVQHSEQYKVLLSCRSLLCLLFHSDSSRLPIPFCIYISRQTVYVDGTSLRIHVKSYFVFSGAPRRLKWCLFFQRFHTDTVNRWLACVFSFKRSMPTGYSDFIDGTSEQRTQSFER